MKKAFIVAGFMSLIFACTFGSSTASAIDLIDCSGANADSTVCKNKDDNAGKMVGNIVNTLLYVLGAVAVIVIIIAAFMYVTSGGDSNRTKVAKDTILYAVIGLIVALMAFAIVNWVVLQTGGAATGGSPVDGAPARPTPKGVQVPV